MAEAMNAIAGFALPPVSPGPLAQVFAGVPFERGRLFDTTDLDEAREVCGRVFNPHQLRVVGPGQRLRSRMDHLPLGGTSLNRLTWGARVAVDPDRLGHYYLLCLPVAGTARFYLDGGAFDVSPSCAAVVNPSQRFHFEASESFDQICIRFERHSVERTWQSLTGAAAAIPIDFAVSMPAPGAARLALEPVLALLARCARGVHADSALPHLAARVEEMLLTTLLLHQCPALAESGAATGGQPRHGAIRPGCLRRAQGHMCEHLDEPLTLGSVARASGVAVRTLQAAFQQHCGMGPMQWLREQRLNSVREMLAAANAGDMRVTEAALRFGFVHLSEFSRAYRLRFGETPRDTLARHG